MQDLLLERERFARAVAERAARARDEVLGVVAHDLRNSLRAIEICASALLAGGQMRSETAEALVKAIQQSAECSDRLVCDLLDVASIEAGHLALDARTQAPGTILSHVASVFAPAAREHGIVLEAHAGAELPNVFADACRVFQALSNLVSNSLKFTATGGFIMLSAVPDPQGVRFSVADSGAGIDADDLPHVFERYWQKPHGARHGVGLGLAIVQGIVDAHGGQLRVTSTREHGSHFSFTIPTVG